MNPRIPSELSVLELRQYTLLGGRRDELIALFEREFIAPQNAVGAQVLGTFRDLDDPDRFVWLRGFANMESRKLALEAFYGGDVWKAHRDAANATMLDSDNVLLLRPVRRDAAPPTAGQGEAKPGVVRMAIHALREVDAQQFTAFFEAALAPRITACGGVITERWVTEPGPNTVPRLPVREHEPVFVWSARFSGVAAEREFAERLASESGWRDGAPEEILPALMRKPEVLRLAPT
jgi:hypothetical protein